MGEPAPGFFISTFVPPGKAYEMAIREIVGSGPERGIAINPRDWERIPAAERELILDAITHADAQRGLREIAQALEAPSE
jgi:hypothetical protein